MSKSIKLTDNNFIDSAGIVHNKELLKDILENKIISESGSNSDGNYIKYADGTMICYGVWTIGAFTTGGNSIGSLWYGDINIWHSFPQKFVSRPEVKLDVYDNRNDFTGSIWLQKKPTTVETTRFGSVRILSATNTTMNISIDFIAIGYWK